MPDAAWFALAVLLPVAIWVIIARHRRRHEVRRIERGGVTYSERLDGSFVHPGGRVVRDAALAAALAATAAYLSARGPHPPAERSEGTPDGEAAHMIRGQDVSHGDGGGSDGGDGGGGD